MRKSQAERIAFSYWLNDHTKDNWQTMLEWKSKGYDLREYFAKLGKQVTSYVANKYFDYAAVIAKQQPKELSLHVANPESYKALYKPVMEDYTTVTVMSRL